MGNYNGAIADCNEALRIDYNHAPAYKTRGYTHAKKGDYEEAIADYQKYVDMGGDVSHTDSVEVENIINGLKKKLFKDK